MSQIALWPGSNQQRASIKPYNRMARHEQLGRSIIEPVEDADDFATQRL